ncbi:MAG: DNA polymerase III subunit beta [Christensenellaceae bacterium]|jgi:DNA polymerase-3 subunit beta|nr:DNA polymerase III subunit beta [Christensenellaceae bacterium]
MKFICESDDLKNAVAIVAHGANGKTLNPILEGIKIAAENGTVTFFATDLEIYLRKTIKADIKKDGIAILPGRLFADYVGKIDGGQISFTAESDTAVIEHGDDNRGNFGCLPANEYPDLINLNEKPAFTIKAGNLKDIITKTTLFASIDNARPILRGVLFEIDAKGHELTAVALDGFRLAKITKPISGSATDTKIIIPARSLDEIKKILTDENEDINIIIENKFVQVAVGSTVFASRLIDGEFVNYKQIIPTEFSSSVVVETNALLSAVNRASLLSRNEKVNLVSLTIGDKQIKIDANSELGKINEKVPANLEGGDIKIAFNSKYLFDAINTGSSEFIKIAFNSPLAPCVITNAKSDDYLFLVLPVRLGV